MNSGKENTQFYKIEVYLEKFELYPEKIEFGQVKIKFYVEKIEFYVIKKIEHRGTTTLMWAAAMIN